MSTHREGEQQQQHVLDPYACVTSPHETAPFIRDSPIFSGKELVFREPLELGAVIFKETSLVLDACIGLSPALHKAHHNERHAWSITEEFLKSVSRAQIEAVVAADYARGVTHAPGMWENPDDDAALDYLVFTYDAAPSLVRDLYDLVATNCVMAELGMRPLQDDRAGGARVMVPYARYGFFLLLSRANHSCTPSATLVPPRGGSRSMTVVTTRSVAAGEALTIDYVQTERLENKRLVIAKNLGFRCLCERCRTLCSLLSCNKKGAKVCGACGKGRYCGREHQAADWPRHKATECEARK